MGQQIIFFQKGWKKKNFFEGENSLKFGGCLHSFELDQNIRVADCTKLPKKNMCVPLFYIKCTFREGS